MMAQVLSSESETTQHMWYPCAQMKDYETFKPLNIVKASGSYLSLKDGTQLIDAISSWWCKSLGHQHPRVLAAIKKQLDKFEHVIAANTTHDIILELSERLAKLNPKLNKVFYAGDGSCAVEVAMKMSLQARQILGQRQKTEFIALENGYHGETLATLSVSDVGLYKAPFAAKTFATTMLTGLPYQDTIDAHLSQAQQQKLKDIDNLISQQAYKTTAILFEPLLQGAGGMKVYNKAFLIALSVIAQKYDIHLIADEIMTGIGRTGKMLASEHAAITPDFICLSKGLTAGSMAMSCVLTHQEIFNLFYDDYESGKAFLHSHTYSANALAAAAGLETLKIIEEEGILEQVSTLHQTMKHTFMQLMQQHPLLTNFRHCGAMVACDIDTEVPRMGYQVYQQAVKLGALLRPLGNTLYWLPPLTTNKTTINKLAEITSKALTLTNSKLRVAK